MASRKVDQRSNGMKSELNSIMMKSKIMLHKSNCLKSKSSNFLLILIIGLLSSCATSYHLKSGIWSGHMTPMNHPEMKTELSFDVSQKNRNTVIVINGPGGMRIPTSNLSIQENLIEFQFNEPEQGVTLSCQFVGSNVKGYSGRCTDDSGKWAVFEMIPPS